MILELHYLFFLITAFIVGVFTFNTISVVLVGQSWFWCLEKIRTGFYYMTHFTFFMCLRAKYRRVFSSVNGLTRNNFQIFYRVVRPVFVFMMNYFGTKKFSPNNLFHYQSMFGYFLTPLLAVNKFIAVAVIRSPSVIMTMQSFSSTFIRAKPLTAIFARSSSWSIFLIAVFTYLLFNRHNSLYTTSIARATGGVLFR